MGTFNIYKNNIYKNDEKYSSKNTQVQLTLKEYDVLH